MGNLEGPQDYRATANCGQKTQTALTESVKSSETAEKED